MTLRGDWGQATFNVDVADEPAEWGQGLMFVESMPRQTGMLFMFDEMREVSFWMRNTLIPLDMIFIDNTGLVVNVHENAIPGDETSIPSGQPVLSVLEINGGVSSVFGIDAGTEVRHPAFAQDTAVWPCE